MGSIVRPLSTDNSMSLITKTTLYYKTIHTSIPMMILAIRKNGWDL